MIYFTPMNLDIIIFFITIKVIFIHFYFIFISISAFKELKIDFF